MLRITLRIVCLLVGLSSAVGARTTSASNTSAPPSGGDQPIAGERLVLTDSPAEAKGSLFSLSRDPTITLGGGNGSADDPTQFGGSLRVRTTTGDRFDSTFSFGPVGIAAGVVFVGDSSRQLRAFDAGTGALLRKLDLGGIITSGPAVVNDMVFVGVGLGPTGEQQGVYGLALQGRHNGRAGAANGTR